MSFSLILRISLRIRATSSIDTARSFDNFLKASIRFKSLALFMNTCLEKIKFFATMSQILTLSCLLIVCELLGLAKAGFLVIFAKSPLGDVALVFGATFLKKYLVVKKRSPISDLYVACIFEVKRPGVVHYKATSTDNSGGYSYYGV